MQVLGMQSAFRMRPTSLLRSALSNPARQAMSLYPSIQPYKSEHLRVSPLHSLSIKQFGNPHGKPTLFVHGGPGGGADVEDARRFDPDKYRIILFDQRGCGESTPASELEDNTTQRLIEDMEKIREYLQVGEKWNLFGGSWGSTLVLAYAQAHPQRVKSMTLRGIFTLRKEELDFFYQGSSVSPLRIQGLMSLYRSRNFLHIS